MTDTRDAAEQALEDAVRGCCGAAAQGPHGGHMLDAILSDPVARRAINEATREDEPRQPIRFIPQECPACGAFIRVAQPMPAVSTPSPDDHLTPLERERKMAAHIAGSFEDTPSPDDASVSVAGLREALNACAELDCIRQFWGAVRMCPDYTDGRELCATCQARAALAALGGRRMSRRVRPKCPRCDHLSAGHQIGVCFVKMGSDTRGKWGETVHHVCACSVWQGPRPWLLEGPAWRFDERGYLR